METIRTFTAFGIFESNVNITVELIKCDDHYEVRETFSRDCTCDDSFTITRKFCFYSMAKYDYDNEVHTIVEFA